MANPIGKPNLMVPFPELAEDETLEQDLYAPPTTVSEQAQIELPKTDIASMVQRLSSRQSIKQPSSSPVEALTSAAPKTAAQEPDYLKQFKDAQQQAKEQTTLANVMDASQGFLKSGLMWGGVSPEEASKVITNEGYQRLREQADKAPEAVTAQMGVESAASKLQQDKEKNDPNSAISKIYEKQAVKLGLPPGYSAAQYEAVLGTQLKIREGEENRAMRLQLAKQAAEDRKMALEEKNKQFSEEAKRKKDQFVSARLQDWQEKNEKAQEKINEQLSKLQNIDSLADLATKNPMAAAQLGVQVAKAMGEVGALSEADVTRYVQNKALAPRVAQNINMMMEGTILKENAEALKESLSALQQMTKDRKGLIVRKRASQFARNMSGVLGMPTSTNEALLYLGEDNYVTDDPIFDAPQTLETAREQLQSKREAKKAGLPRATQSIATSSPKKITSPDGRQKAIETFMKNNPSIKSKEEAEKILTKKEII